MQISWHGQYTVKILTKDDVLIIDPYSPEVGLNAFRAKATLVALSNPSEKAMSHVGGVQGDFAVINTPGEYSIRGFTLYALGWQGEDGHEKNVQLWTIEDTSILHLGALNRELSDKELQEIERVGIDILLLPVGGGSGLNVKQAMTLLTTIEPRMVIPIHYKLPALKEELESVDHFAKELGVKVEPQPKVIIKAKNLPQEEMQTVILQP